MTSTATMLLWATGIAVLLGVVAFVVLKWVALRIAGRVAESTERHLTASVSHALSRSGVGTHAVIDRELRANYLAQIERLGWLTDRVVPLPVVGGLGIDAILGLIPVVGDVVSLGISSAIVIRAAQLGVSRDLISRLVAIQCTDLVLGTVPIVGDLVDVAYRANVRSVRLIREFVDEASSISGATRDCEGS